MDINRAEFYKKSGETLRMLREQKGLSRKDLCKCEHPENEICTTIALARYEAGATEIPGFVLQQFLEILSITHSDFMSLVNGDDITSFQNDFNEIWTLCGNKKFEDAQKKFEELKNQDYCNQDNLAIKQQLFLCEAMFSQYVNKNSDLSLNTLYNALQITRTNVLDIDNELKHKIIAGSVFTLTEYRILNLITAILSEQGQRRHVIRVYNALYESLNSKKVNSDIRVKLLANVYFNLSNVLIDDKKYTKALAVCEEGISFCQNHTKFGMYGRIVYNKGKALYHIGDIKNAELNFRESCEIHRSQGDEIFAEKIRLIVAEKYGIYI